nr:TetR-like C-terminal domain-containing protein [Maliibacterium massiliense]
MSPTTKALLAAALKKRMAKKALEKITIKELVGDCGVNRQTFYYHFSDIYDLLGWIFQRELIDALRDARLPWQEHFAYIFRYMEENRAFCLAAYHSHGREMVERKLYALVSGMLQEVMDSVPLEAAVTRRDKAFIVDFYTYAFIGLLGSWLNCAVRESPQDMTQHMERLIKTDIFRLLLQLQQ